MSRLIAWSAALMLTPAAAAAAAEESTLAREILAKSGVQGGLVVHVHCGDGKLTAALRANDRYVVQGLQDDPIRLADARKNIQALGAYGPVSVMAWDGRQLPYAENLVNLVVAEDPGGIAMDEILRVLVPGGVAYVQRDGTWTKTQKPWPSDIDEWTHWLHDAGNNAVAHDSRVGPPRRTQWVAEPLWSRGHEVISSVGGVVTARGRIFYAMDEGQSGIYVLPSKWTLVARDAFNGILLWKRPIPDWSPAVSLGGHADGFRPRRLVTDGQRVYLPTGEEALLTALDAATGQPLKTLEEAGGTAEILCADGLVVAVVARERGGGEERRSGGSAGGPSLLAARADTLQVLWRAPASGLVAQTPALSGGRVFFRAGGEIIALHAKTGTGIWRTPVQDPPVKDEKRSGSTTLMVYDGTVYVESGSKVMALRAQSGELIWEGENGEGARRKGELFAAAGLLWRTRGSSIVGQDLATGLLRQRRDPSAVFSQGHHPRCYPCKATDRYVITNIRGAEFVSLTSDDHVGNDWLRGNCGHGVMPANGLLYAPPCQCFCYGGVMLTGFKALGPGPVAPPTVGLNDADRHQRGPAYSPTPTAQSLIPTASDWPTYRHDPQRLGSTPTAVPADVRPLWQAWVGGRLTPPVMAGGMVLVAARDTHTVHAFDAQSGRPTWSFTAGGRIDSPPTIHEGLVLLGSADGWAYCLRAADGQLAWRFRASPEERFVGAFGRLESAWPVHGSVMVLHGIAYFTAGRSTHLDGGIYAYGLEPKTGRVLHFARLEGAALPPGQPPPAEQPFVPAFHVEGTRSDLLVTDGTFLYMGPLKLDAKLVRQPTPYIVPDHAATGMDLSKAPFVDTDIFRARFEKNRGTDFAFLGPLCGPMGDKRMGLRMFATGGLLDDSGYNRIYWMYSAIWPGYYIAHLSAKAGQLIVADERTTYAVQYFPSRTIHSATFTPGTKGYLLFADDNTNEPVLDDRARGRDKGMGYTRAAAPKWFEWVPVRVRGMVASGGTLFVAGPPDVMDEADPYAAFEGRRGAVLWSLATADGEKLAELPLDAEPVFDGLIAASGRLYLSGRDGRLVCLGTR